MLVNLTLSIAEGVTPTKVQSQLAMSLVEPQSKDCTQCVQF